MNKHLGRVWIDRPFLSTTGDVFSALPGTVMDLYEDPDPGFVGMRLLAAGYGRTPSGYEPCHFGEIYRRPDHELAAWGLVHASKAPPTPGMTYPEATRCIEGLGRHVTWIERREAYTVTLSHDVIFWLEKGKLVRLESAYDLFLRAFPVVVSAHAPNAVYVGELFGSWFVLATKRPQGPGLPEHLGFIGRTEVLYSRPLRYGMVQFRNGGLHSPTRLIDAFLTIDQRPNRYERDVL
jgi:hypothetical protein